MRLRKGSSASDQLTMAYPRAHRFHQSFAMCTPRARQIRTDTGPAHSHQQTTGSHTQEVAKISAIGEKIQVSNSCRKSRAKPCVHMESICRVTVEPSRSQGHHKVLVICRVSVDPSRPRGRHLQSACRPLTSTGTSSAEECTL